MSSHSTKSPLRFYLLAALLWISAMPALAQQYQEIPAHSLVGNLGFMSNPGYAVTIPELVAALSAQGLALDQLDRVGDSNFTIPSGDRVVAHHSSPVASQGPPIDKVPEEGIPRQQRTAEG
jgi:hypothetical protein